MTQHPDVQKGKDYTSQLCLAANLFGVLGSTLVLYMLNGRPVCNDNYVDLWSLMRRPQADVQTDEQQLRAWANGPGGDSDPLLPNRAVAQTCGR